MWAAMLFSMLSALIAVDAQQQAMPHPLSALPPPGQITTGFFFPDHPDKHFAAGKAVSAVLGFHNDASELYNITAIMGSLNSPTDFNIFVQNFTQQLYQQSVDPGSEISLDYKFVPAPGLEPRDFVVALTVFYHDVSGQYYSNTFFNQTVEIIEVKKLVDWELISMFLILAGLAAAIGYVIYTFLAPHLASLGFMRKGKKVKVEKTAKASADDQDEWLKDSNYEAHKKKRAAAAEKRSAKSKK